MQSRTDTTPSASIERSIERGEFSPLYLFYGEEDLLIEETLQLLIESAIEGPSRSFNLDVVYGAEADARHIASLASSYPMMAERRVVVVREFDKLPNKDLLLSYILKPSPTTSLVMIASKPDFRVKVYKAIKEQGIPIEFKPLYESNIPQWINGRVERLGKAISAEACELMPAYVGRSLREIQNEIDKLFIYVGEKKKIEVDDVNSIVGMSRQFNVFELQSAIGAKNIARVLEIVERMLDAGEQPIGIIVRLTRYFQQLWIIQDCLARKKSKQEIATVLRLPPKQMFFLENDVRSAQRFTSGEVRRAFALLEEADESLKTSNGDARLVMTLLLYNIVKGARAEVHKEKAQI